MIAAKYRRAMMTFFVIASLVQFGGAQQSLRQPEQGVLLLKHGTTISGFITPAGDRYIVLLGESGEARVPAADVVAVVGSLQAAYEYKRSMLAESLAARIDLSQWCLQHNLPARAADQLLAAERIYGRQPQLESLHQRLLARANVPPARSPDDDAKAIAKVNFEEELNNLPSSSLDSFTSMVQPLLLNRCASGGCHNTRGTSDYVLFRPFQGQATTRRLTERNLQATFAYLDRSAPLDSPILAMAAVAHGGAEAAPLDEREQKQLDLLSEWVRSLGTQPRPFEPSTISPTTQLLYQPSRLPNANSNDSTVETPSPRPPLAEPIGDPFDPARFNQRHHGRSE